MTEQTNNRGPKGPQDRRKRSRKPRRVGHVGQAYLEAVERQKAEQRKAAAKAMNAIGLKVTRSNFEARA